ncbi:alpha/beta hydrolase fold domain-containing protein [Nocardia sp. R6R-6]|uniref:alpha/beta hydrolase fold domain-containing protein n=1 Tax=Nocardia sp. R6R-6 TaxID=3459303 RepID=UPI00403D5799
MSDLAAKVERRHGTQAVTRAGARSAVLNPAGPSAQSRLWRATCMGVARLGAEVDGMLDPALSPVNAALSALAPVRLIAAEDEVLRFDHELMPQRLTAAGAPNTLELWRGQTHAFLRATPNPPKSRVAPARVSRLVRTCIEEDQQARTA